jgi:site-specific recombinase XerC
MARLRKRNGVYQAIYYGPDGRRRWKSTRCSDKRAAESAAGRFEREAQDPNTAAEDETSLGDALELLIDFMGELVGAGRRSAGTLSMHRDKAGHLRRVFEFDAETGELVPFRLSALHSRHVDDYISQRRREGAAENTIAKELVTLRSTLKLALRRGHWSGEPSAILPTRFAPEYRPRSRYLTRAELDGLLEHMTGDHAARVAFSVATSANRGETFRARREDITDGAVFVRGTKRSSRRRTVPIVSAWQQDLVRYAVEHAQGQDGKLFAFDGGFRAALDRACTDTKAPHCTSNLLPLDAPERRPPGARGGRHGAQLDGDGRQGLWPARHHRAGRSHESRSRIQWHAGGTDQCAPDGFLGLGGQEEASKSREKWCRRRESNPHALTDNGF